MFTIAQARKLLPEGYNLSDKEVAAAIADWYAFANVATDEFFRRRSNQKGEKDERK